MSALLLKDWYVLWRRMKLFLLVIIVMAAIPFSFYSVFVVAWAAMLPYTVLAYDEQSKWDRLAAMMPYSRRELVLSKYVLGWAAIGASSAAALALPRLLRPLWVRLNVQASPLDGSPLGVLLAACVGVIILALTLPLFFRFGVERGRMAMILLVGLVCGSGAAVATMLELASMGGDRGLVVILPPALAAALTAASVPLSMRFYSRHC